MVGVWPPKDISNRACYEELCVEIKSAQVCVNMKCLQAPATTGLKTDCIMSWDFVGIFLMDAWTRQGCEILCWRHRRDQAEVLPINLSLDA
jgi:hypothetical protein